MGNGDGGGHFTWQEYPFSVALLDPLEEDIASISVSLHNALECKSTDIDGKRVYFAVFDDSPSCASAFLNIFSKASKWRNIYFFRTGIELSHKQVSKWADCYLCSLSIAERQAYCRCDCVIRSPSDVSFSTMLVSLPCRHINLNDTDGVIPIISDTEFDLISEVQALAASKKYNFCPNIDYSCVKILKVMSEEEFHKYEQSLYGEKTHIHDIGNSRAEYEDFSNRFGLPHYPKNYTITVTVNSKEEDDAFIENK